MVNLILPTSAILLGLGLPSDAFLIPKHHSHALTSSSWPSTLPRTIDTRRDVAIEPIIETAQHLAGSLFQYNGHVPLIQAFGINLFGFTVLREKLLKSLTMEGYFHAMALGTGLWTTLGWRGWTLCVLYLVLGQLGTLMRGMAWVSFINTLIIRLTH